MLTSLRVSIPLDLVSFALLAIYFMAICMFCLCNVIAYSLIAFMFLNFCVCIFIGPLFRKTVADSNAPVQEKALDALICYLKAADADAGR